ncbi:hypothetical protein BGZ63DRAFT_401975 [Mariannaea sp. PMI_226]|nr:hypothetical protein BGZ63DRAFT_401975 [Mariannaea sp. PMI_226]
MASCAPIHGSGCVPSAESCSQNRMSALILRNTAVSSSGLASIPDVPTCQFTITIALSYMIGLCALLSSLFTTDEFGRESGYATNYFTVITPFLIQYTGKDTLSLAN